MKKKDISTYIAKLMLLITMVFSLISELRMMVFL
jgi:hypothetical protein